MGKQWGLNALIMPSSLCLFFMSDMRDRELLHFGSSMSPQVSPIQGSALAGHLSWLLTSFASTHTTPPNPLVQAPEPFSLSKGKSTSVTEVEKLNKQLCLPKEGQRQVTVAEAKASFLICALQFDSSRSHLSEPALRNNLCVMCATKGSAKPSLLWNRIPAFKIK